MKYTWIQREDTDSFITIGEYILETDPETFKEICKMYVIKLFVDTTQCINKYLPKMFSELCKKITSISTREIEHLMQERPKPGRGGLLPGETEEDLYKGGGQDE